jgi:hypothetical protein
MENYGYDEKTCRKKKAGKENGNVCCKKDGC